MTDGTYLGPRPVAPIPEDLVSSQEHALTLWPEISRFVAGQPEVRRIFLVGAGGSLLGLASMQYVLDRHALTPSVSMNSDEFFYRASPQVGPGAFVIVLSGTGMTPETVRAAKWAEERGAAVAAVTLKAEGDLAKAVKTAFIGKSIVANQMILQLLALALLERDGVDTAAMHEALKAMPQALLTALDAYESRTAEITLAMKDEPVTYVMASGPLLGSANVYTMCYLQEMQWMHAQAINSNEFFQGPFEVIDKNTKCILFLGEDETRPMGERVRRFLDSYGGTTFYIDGRDFPLPGVADDMRGYVLPLVFSGLTARLAAHTSALRGYALEGRRYMWKVDY